MIMGIKNWVAMKKYLCFFSFCSLFCSCVKNFDPDLVGTTSDGKLIERCFFYHEAGQWRDVRDGFVVGFAR